MNKEREEDEYYKKVSDELFKTKIFCKCGKTYGIDFNIVLEKFEVYEL